MLDVLPDFGYSQYFLNKKTLLSVCLYNRDRDSTCPTRRDLNLLCKVSKANMADSFELRDELQALQDIDTYSIPHDHDLSSEDPARLLEGTSLSHCH